MEASLITNVVSTSSQSDMVGVKSEYCSNSFSRSTLVVSCIVSLLLVLLSFVVVVYIFSFMVASGDFRSSGGLSGFFFRLFFAYFSKKVFNCVNAK